VWACAHAFEYVCVCACVCVRARVYVRVSVCVFVNYVCARAHRHRHRHRHSTESWHRHRIIHIHKCDTHPAWEAHLSSSKRFLMYSSFCRHDPLSWFAWINKSREFQRFYISSQLSYTGWRRRVGCLIFIGHLLQTSPIISGSLAKNDLHLRHPIGLRHPVPYSSFYRRGPWSWFARRT